MKIEKLIADTDSEFKYEALMKKRILDMQIKNRFDTDFDFLLEELEELKKEIKQSLINPTNSK